MEFFSHLHNLPELIRWGGYAALILIVFAETGLLVGFFLPGDSLLVTAGLLAAVDNIMRIDILFISLSLAAIIGDSVGYAIGHFAGPKIFKKENSLFFNKDHVEKAHRFYEKYGAKTIVIARFVPIVRTFAPTIAGVARMSYAKFISYNVFGGILWVGSMLFTGYFLGNSIPDIEKKLHWIILIVIFISVLPIVREFWIAYQEKKSAK